MKKTLRFIVFFLLVIGFSNSCKKELSNWTPSNEYATVLAAMPTTPSLADQKNQDKWLKAMVDRGYYAKAELLDMFSVDTHENGLINWKNPGTFNPERINTPEFYPYQGFRGLPPGSVVKLHFIPSSDGTLISRNNTCVIIGIGRDLVDPNADFGAYDGVAKLEIRARYTGDKTYFRDNDAGSSTNSNTDAIKYYAISRGVAGNFDTYNNKVKQNFAVASVAAVTNELYACGENDNGTIAASRRITRFVFVFSYLTEVEIHDIIDITEEYLINYHSNIINYDSYVVKTYPTTKSVVSLTTYDGSGETCHPSVVAIAAGWNGYKYWMANTPYPANNSAVENPSIWQSNDGVTWTVPAGLTNPVIAKPATGSGYNADTDLFYNSDDNKLYMIWKEDARVRCTKMCSSSDGVTWSVPNTILTPSGTTTENTSPSLIKIGAKYYIYFNALNATILNSVIKRVSCDTIDGTYANEEVVNVPSALVIEGEPQIWWHLDISYLNGYYYLSAVCSQATGSGKNIFIMKSSDGINFVRSPYPTVNYTKFSTEGENFYRPSLAIIEGHGVLYYGDHLSTNKWACVKMNVDLL